MGSGGADISRHTNKKPRRGALQGFYRNWCASVFAGWGRMRFIQTHNMRTGSRRWIRRRSTPHLALGIRCSPSEVAEWHYNRRSECAGQGRSRSGAQWTKTHKGHRIKTLPPANACFGLSCGGPARSSASALIASHDDVPRTTGRVFPDTGSDFSGGRRFHDSPGNVGLDFWQEQHAIPCCRYRGK
jgi:hypothetical protein